MVEGGNSADPKVAADRSHRATVDVLTRDDEVEPGMSVHPDGSCTIPERFAIALDGPAAAGKSTVAALVAKRLGAVVFDTGILYRAVTLASIEDDIHHDDAGSLARLAGEIDVDVRPPSVDDGRTLDILFRGRDVTWELRSPDVDRILSHVAALPDVRSALLEPQRRIARSGRVIIVGRDIGTVVVPDADLKVYLEASVEERARRRFEETRDSENALPLDDVLKALVRRDHLDSERATAPLRPAEDAVVIDSDNVPATEVAGEIVQTFCRRVADAGRRGETEERR
jgi:CMP/dCMP kinase